jgi:uncharacterized membrane protein
MKLYLGAGLSLTLALLMPLAAGAQTAGADDFDTMWRMVRKRCAICHSAIPQEDGLNFGSQPPKGVVFDQPSDLRKFAPQVMAQAVQSKLMPPDNATHMTDAERATLGRWIEAGAKVP